MVFLRLPRDKLYQVLSELTFFSGLNEFKSQQFSSREDVLNHRASSSDLNNVDEVSFCRSKQTINFSCKESRPFSFIHS